MIYVFRIPKNTPSSSTHVVKFYVKLNSSKDRKENKKHAPQLQIPSQVMSGKCARMGIFSLYILHVTDVV